MNNLPILPNTAPANSKVTSPSNGANKSNDDTDQNAQPFGEVLARQINDKASDAKNKADSGAAELLGATATDKKTNDTNLTGTTAPLPTDMLATLLPQSAAVVVAQVNIPVQPAIVNEQQAVVSGRYKTPLNATDIAADNKSAAASQDIKLTDTVDKKGVFAIALNSSADKVVPKNIELNAQPAPTAQLPSMANITALATQVAPLVINTPVSQGRWADEFSQKITWLASSKQDQSAELHLNPPQLGPLDVVLKVSGDQATALFTSPHAAVRDVLEQSIPKLREMLADNGIMLGNATVSDQAPHDQRGEFANQGRTAPSGRVMEFTPSNASTSRTTPIIRHNGIVDTFA